MLILLLNGDIKDRIYISKKMGLYLRNMNDDEYAFFYSSFIKGKEDYFFNIIDDGLGKKVFSKFLILDIKGEKEKQKKILEVNESIKRRKQNLEKYGNILNLILFIKTYDGNISKLNSKIIYDVNINRELILSEMRGIAFDYLINENPKLNLSISDIKDSISQLGFFLDLIYEKESEKINFIGEIITIIHTLEDDKLNFTLLITVLEFLIVNDSRKNRNESIRYQIKTKSISILNNLKFYDKTSCIILDKVGKEFGKFYDIRSGIIHGNNKEMLKKINEYKNIVGSNSDDYNLSRCLLNLKCYMGKILKVYMYDSKFVNTLKDN